MSKLLKYTFRTVTVMASHFYAVFTPNVKHFVPRSLLFSALVRYFCLSDAENIKRPEVSNSSSLCAFCMNFSLKKLKRCIALCEFET